MQRPPKASLEPEKSMGTQKILLCVVGCLWVRAMLSWKSRVSEAAALLDAEKGTMK